MSSSSKPLANIKINLVCCLAFFIFIYIFLLLQTPSPFSENFLLHHCPSSDNNDQVEEGISINEEKKTKERNYILNNSLTNFVADLPRDPKIALINIGDEDTAVWQMIGKSSTTARVTQVSFEKVPETLEWKHLFPEWIDEEEENEGALCPELPMPELSNITEDIDVIVARVQCKWPEKDWARDVHRFQVHLAAANVAARKGKRDGNGKVRLVIAGTCRPMIEVFSSDDLVRREGEFWFYEADGTRLEDKVKLPVGSCKLALPLWKEEGNEEVDLSKLATPANPRLPEAYVTVLHSSDVYVCGAVVLAHSIRQSGSHRDLILLHDRTIRGRKLNALAAAGWKLRNIKRIRNPKAKTKSYNEYNYSKLRLWQLTQYRKLVFIDADILVLRNLDFLFTLPEMSAVGNDGVIFNSGVMVIEPSENTFKVLMSRRAEVVSYNGGDQGFLNEVFVWWHRLPRRVNYLKNFWANTSAETMVKNHMFAADPPAAYAVHYLGLKPWLCYRDYDCNWNVDDQRVYASDTAHRRWWKMYDEIDQRLINGVCRLSSQRKADLVEERDKAQDNGYTDGHWQIKITDRRNFQ